MEYSGVATGAVIAARLAPARWGAKVDLAPMVHTKARALQAKIEALDGPMGSFFFCSPANCYPASDPGGVMLGGSAPKVAAIGADNKSISLLGLPPTYKITTGDMLDFTYGSNPQRRYLGRAIGAAISSSSGVTPLFEVRPHLPAGLTVGVAVNLKKPAAKVFIVPGSLQVSHSGRFSQMSFEVMQRP